MGEMIRPGWDISIQSGHTGTGEVSGKGVTVIPLLGASWGQDKSTVEITADTVREAEAILGYSITEKALLMVREALKAAGKVIVYLSNHGEKAKATLTGDITCTARHGGMRGNEISIAVTANAVAGHNVTVYLAGAKKYTYEKVKSTAELLGLSCPLVSFNGTGDLAPVAGVTLEGGSDGAVTNEDVTDFLDTLEFLSFDTFAFPVDGEDAAELKKACQAKLLYLNQRMRRCVHAAIPNYAADTTSIYNVTNGVVLNYASLSAGQACAWVAAADAAATATESLTGMEYPGAVGVVGGKKAEEAELAIKNGEFFFSLDEGKVVVEYDINSLVTLEETMEKSYRKGRVQRVFRDFTKDLRRTFPKSKYGNNEEDWKLEEGLGKALLGEYQKDGAIKNVSDQDFVIDRGRSVGDETYVTIGLQPVDSSEKYYFSITTR